MFGGKKSAKGYKQTCKQNDNVFRSVALMPVKPRSSLVIDFTELLVGSASEACWVRWQ